MPHTQIQLTFDFLKKNAYFGFLSYIYGTIMMDEVAETFLERA